MNRYRHFRRGRRSCTRLSLTRAIYCWRQRNASRCLSSMWRNGRRKNDERSATSWKRRKNYSNNFSKKHIWRASMCNPFSLTALYICSVVIGTHFRLHVRDFVLLTFIGTRLIPLIFYVCDFEYIKCLSVVVFEMDKFLPIIQLKSIAVSFAALRCHLLGHHSMTSRQSMAKTSDSRALRRCATVNRFSATISLSCVSEKKKSHGLIERRSVVLYLWILSYLIRNELIFCGFVAVPTLRHDIWFIFFALAVLLCWLVYFDYYYN